MPQDIENALAACEELLRQGVSLEECVQRFPEQREALEPLLCVYQISKKSWDDTLAPSKEGLQRARARFLTEAVALREAEETRSVWSRFFENFVSLTTARGLAIAVYVLAFFTVAVTITTVAQGALPGDPLYSVKRHSEDVVMLLDRSEALKERLDQRRVEEVETLTERAPDKEIIISGAVGKVAELSLRVDGIPVQIPKDMLGKIPAEGTRVRVVGIPQGDHILLTEEPLVKAPPRPTKQTMVEIAPATATATVAPTVTATVTATVTLTATDTASAIMAVTEPTLAATKAPATATPMVATVPPKTATPTSTATPTPTSTPSPTKTATVTLTATLTSTPTAAPTLTSTATATAMPTIAHTPVPTETKPPLPPRPITVRIEGCIQQIEIERWLVEGKWIDIPIDRFAQERAAAFVGAGVVIRAVEKPNGELEAEAITIQEPQIREFNGAIEEIAEEYWQVAGRIVHIDDTTEITGERIIGARAQVVADEYCDGYLRARSISIVTEPETLVGRVLTVAEDHWVLSQTGKPDGQRVSFDEDTEIHGEVMVGATVQINAIRLLDESLLARSVYVLSSPPSTHMPTATPLVATSTPTGAVPKPTPTKEPEEEPKSTPSSVPSTATVEPTAPETSVQPSPTSDLEEATSDPMSPTTDKKWITSEASLEGESMEHVIKTFSTPILVATQSPRS
jgi:hypothetical protein